MFSALVANLAKVATHNTDWPVATIHKGIVSSYHHLLCLWSVCLHPPSPLCYIRSGFRGSHLLFRLPLVPLCHTRCGAEGAHLSRCTTCLLPGPQLITAGLPSLPFSGR